MKGRMKDFTPKSKWLGGFVDPITQTQVRSKDQLKKLMEERGFAKMGEQQVPLLIREHQRKYQYIVSEATIWRKK
ncbi:mug158 [Symbiodinium pilosum]|uniref:Mug158 protein n=1 Tax=Symbiodinium pilosum TaxID=2952 RepID=A0A812X9Q4_SYMPI|nr:mug158 [Symbiodinium pilosum]